MKQSYKTTYADFKDAQKLHLRTNRKAVIAFWLFLRIIPALAAVFAVCFWLKIIYIDNPAESAAGAILIGMGVWGFLTALWRPFSIRRLYKRMKNGRSDDDPIEIEIADGHLISRVPGMSEGRFLPNAVRKFIEDDRIGLLYISPRLFLMLPKRALEEPVLEEVRTWCASGSVLQQKVKG